MQFLFFYIQRLFFIILLFFSYLHAESQMRQVYSDLVSTNNEIQKISFYSPSAGYIASTDNSFNWVGFTTDSGRTITRRLITLGNVNYNGYIGVNLTFGFGIKGVKAFNQDTIIAYGDYGLVPAILYSTNGGVSYLLVYHSQFNSQQLSGGITDMVFPQNNNIGYAIDADRILKTTNKGLTWSVIRTDPDSYFSYLEAVDNNTLFTFSTSYLSSKILKTTNAGASWQQLSIPGPTIFYADFLTPNKGWLNVSTHLTDSLRLFYTTDGGSSWVQKNNATATPFFCRKMQFVNDSTGYSIGNYFDTYKTTDSGKVWQPLPRDNNFSYLYYSHNEMQCISENQLWSGGMRDFLEISTNGGGIPLPKAFFIIDTAGVSSTSVVNLYNFSKPNYQYKWFVNNTLISTNYHAAYTHNASSQVDSVVLIVISGLLSDTVKKYQPFSVPNLPVIYSFSPATGSSTSLVTITGTGFLGVTSVKFGGTPAASFSIISNTQINAIVAGGSSGPVSVSNTAGTYSLAGFTYYAPPASPPPVITSFSPTSGPVGTIVTISGNNFSTSPSNNIIHFGAVRATVTSASQTQLTCSVPPGSSFEPLTVLNTNTTLVGHSFKPFNVTYADSSNFTPNSYLNVLNFSYSGGPKHVIGKDLDGDGKPDLTAIISSLWDSIVVYRNTTDGANFSFGPRKNIGFVQNFSPGMFKVNDIDGDGKPDIISATNSADLAIFRNLSVPGTLAFTNQVSLLTNSTGSQDVAIADFDNDGKNDITVAGFSNKTVSVIKNTSVPGFLSFATPVSYTTVHNPVDVDAGDLDGDGKPDIVSYNYNGLNNTTFTCFRNTTTGNVLSFAAGIDFNVPGSSVSTHFILVADYDNDNKLDVILATDNNYCIFRNTSITGSIAFAPAFSVTIGTFPQNGAVIISNLSGDNKPDLLLGNTAFRTFELIRNMSVPSTIINDDPIKIQEGATNSWLSNFTNAADFNIDGKMDVVISSSSDDKIAIFKNNMGNPISFSSSAFCPGSTQQRSSDVIGNTYQWQQNTGSGFINISNNATFSGTQTITLTIASIPYAWNGYIYRCVVNGNLYSSQFVLVMNPSAPPSISIFTATNSICYGTPVLFTATGTNTGPTTSYGWQVNGSFVPNESGSTFTTSTLANGSTVRGYLSNSCSNPNFAFSNIITMTVTGQPATVTISTPQTIICAGTSVTFSSSVTNPGVSPSYQWQVNGFNAGTNSPNFTTSSLSNGAQVSLILTTAATSCGTNPPVTSNVIIMTVNNPVAPTVSISTNTPTICQGANAFFAASYTSGGSSPSFQWQLNGNTVGGTGPSYSSSSLANGDQIKTIMTSNATCITGATATSNTVTMTVNNTVIPTISISGVTTVNAGQPTVLSTTIVNGGSGPAFAWQDSTSTHTWQSTGQTSSTINYTPQQTGNKIRCTLSSNANCATPAVVTSNALTFTVNVVTAVNPIPATTYGIVYFPNPVESTLYIDSLRLADIWQTVDLVGVGGNVIVSSINISNRTSINISVKELSSGQYFAVLRRKNGAVTYLKFIKQ